MAKSPLLPVASLWVGDNPSILERLSMASFIACGHQYELYAYRDYPDLPDGVTVKDANAILPEEYIYYSRAHQDVPTASGKQISPFADWFRFELLAKRSVWWSDTDMICLRPLDLEGDLVAGIESDSPKTTVNDIVTYYSKLFKWHKRRWKVSSYLINSALIKCTNPKHPVILALRRLCRDPLLYEIYRRLPVNWRRRFDLNAVSSPTTLISRLPLKLIQKRRSFRESQLAGPARFTEIIVKYQAYQHVQRHHVFYPVYWQDWESLLDDTYAGQSDPFPRSYTVHLWNDMLRRNDIDKNTTFAPDSFIEQMKRRYLGTKH